MTWRNYPNATRIAEAGPTGGPAPTSPNFLGDFPSSMGYASSRASNAIILPDPWDIRAQALPGRVRGPRAGRLATVNSLKPDAVWIRARSARGGEAAVSLHVGVRA